MKVRLKDLPLLVDALLVPGVGVSSGAAPPAASDGRRQDSPLAPGISLPFPGPDGSARSRGGLRLDATQRRRAPSGAPVRRARGRVRTECSTPQPPFWTEGLLHALVQPRHRHAYVETRS
jgi:hypothetical protein